MRAEALAVVRTGWAWDLLGSWHQWDLENWMLNVRERLPVLAEAFR